jgi:hypothetical protein
MGTLYVGCRKSRRVGTRHSRQPIDSSLTLVFKTILNLNIRSIRGGKDSTWSDFVLVKLLKLGDSAVQNVDIF